MTKRRVLAAAGSAAFLAISTMAACGGDDSGGPTGPAFDGGPDVTAPHDSGARDAVGHDEGVDAPLPPPVDAGLDAPPAVDAGVDAPPPADAGSDAAAPVDAGSDASPPADAGVDASASDAAAGDAASPDASMPDGSMPDAPPPDAASPDSGDDGSIPVDAGADSPPDVGIDAGSDAPASCGSNCPVVCGDAQALGNWTLANCPAMSPSATPGVYQLTVSIPAGTSQYKVLPNRAFDGTELGTVCGCNGSSFTSAVGACSCNVTIDLPAAGVVTIRYDTRALDSTWAPVPTSHGDTATALYTPSGGAQRWIALGTFQKDLGASADYSPCFLGTEMVDDGTHGDVAAGDGIYTFEFVAPRAYSAGSSPPGSSEDQWKAISLQTDSVCDFAGTTKLGGNGWSYDQGSAFCTADSSHYCADATNVGLTAASGATVHLELDTGDGRLHTTVR